MCTPVLQRWILRKHYLTLNRRHCLHSTTTEIPSLLGNTDEIHKDEHGAAMDMDDGFGTFRPSTSFNDLAALTAASVVAPPVAASGAAPLAPVVSSASLAPSPGTTAPMPAEAAAAGSATVVVVKRKAAANGANGPAAKRRNSTGGRKTPGGSVSSKKKSATKAAGTPNPLTSFAATQTAAAVAAVVAPQLQPMAVASSTVATKIAPVKPCASGVALPPAVVTPPTTAPEQATTTATVTPVATTTTTTSMPMAISKAVAQASKLVAKPIVPAPVTSAASAVAVPTEADFKGVAQAAVNNLILNAGGGDKGTGAETMTPLSTEKVDTSSEHIKALTGSNWVSVCGGGDVGSDSGGSEAKNVPAVPATAQQSADQQNKARRQNLTPDERARQNRNRNREHARNTRLRKKAYVEELKRTLTALVNQRDSAETEKRHSAQRELEQREVRFRVLEEFLKLRGRNEANPARWAAIFEENMTLTLPVTDFRGMVHSPASGEVGNSIQEQVVTGVPEIMQDSAHCAAFLQGLGLGQGGGTAVTLQYYCDRKNFFMDSCTAMLEFTASTAGAMEQVRCPLHFMYLVGIYLYVLFVLVPHNDLLFAFYIYRVPWPNLP